MTRAVPFLIHVVVEQAGQVTNAMNEQIVYSPNARERASQVEGPTMASTSSC